MTGLTVRVGNTAFKVSLVRKTITHPGWPVGSAEKEARGVTGLSDKDLDLGTGLADRDRRCESTLLNRSSLRCRGTSSRRREGRRSDCRRRQQRLPPVHLERRPRPLTPPGADHVNGQLEVNAAAFVRTTAVSCLTRRAIGSATALGFQPQPDRSSCAAVATHRGT